MRKTYEIFADYHQILFSADPSLDAPVDITDEDCRRRIVVGDHVITVMPERNMVVPMTVDVLDAAPPPNLALWDHVAEASVDLGDGTLAVLDLMGAFTDVLPVAPGHYRLRFSAAALGSLSPDGLDGDDHYAVTLWPAPLAPVEVLKQWEAS